MRYEVHTPLKGYSGTVADVVFAGGRAVVDGSQRAALAYFHRHGYGILPVKGEPLDSGGSVADAAEPGRTAPVEPGGQGDEDGDESEGAGRPGEPEPRTATEQEAERLPKPAKNAPVAAWTAYTAQLLGVLADDLGGKTKVELQELVAEHEKKGTDQ
jgi:hypothetical protein